ncbi:MAG: Hsp20/alpha crystallin family protein [Flexilinea sp.]
MYRTLRIQPMRELFTMQDSMDRLVNAFFDSDEKSLSDTVAPRVDLKQDEDKISIKMTIPGVDPENIQISVADNVLTVKAEVEEDKEETDEKSVYQIREHRWSSFYREISLPAEVEADKAKADYKNGVLKLELPKAEIVKPKVISISTGKKETA